MGSAFFVKNFLEPVDYNINKFRTSAQCVIFMPSMHERYGFLYEILALILAVLDAKLIIPAIVLELMSLMTYGAFLVNTEINLQILGWINIGIYLFYIYHFFFISLRKRVKPKDCVKAE